jgi:outer membrane receptor for ferric coprogen and ferric-rhodotorulic acid
MFCRGRWEGHRVQNTADLNVSGPFTLFGREHDLVAGFMTSHSRQTGDTYDGSAFEKVPGSIFDWNGKLPSSTSKNGDYTTTQSQNGAYVATACGRPTSFRSSSAPASAPSSTTMMKTITQRLR